MLRFLRKYNAHILVVGGCLLMVAFLVEPTINSCQQTQPGAYDNVVGRFKSGGELTSEDIQLAQMEMAVLEISSPLLSVRGLDPMQWLLMLHDAERLGISASDAEAQAILNSCGATEATIGIAMSRSGAGSADLLRAVRHWAILQQYQSIALGVSYSNPIQRLQRAMEFSRMGGSEEPNMQLAVAIYNMDGGNATVSEPLLKRFVYDQRAEAKITAIEIPASKYQSEIKPPTTEEMKALYEANKDVVAGEGKPYGFGYRMPDRIKFEYLRVPLDRARDAVKIDEVDAYDYYVKNKDLFIIVPPKKPVEPLLPEFPKTPLLPDPTKDGDSKDDFPGTGLPKTEGPTLPLPETPKKEESKDAKEAPQCGEEPIAAEPIATLAQADDKEKAKDGDFKTQPGTTTQPPLDPTQPGGFFTPPPTTAGPKYQPYEEVRTRVIALMRDQKSKELVARMMTEARNILSQDYQGLKQIGAYYATETPGWTPTPLSEVAQKLQKRFDVLPDVVRFDGEWVDRNAVNSLPNIGNAVLEGEQATAADYLFSVYELIGPSSNSRLAGLRLQEDLPSQPVTDFFSSYILRVIDVQKAHTPSYEESLPQVDRDARKLAAYKVLLTKRDEWVAQAKEKRIEEISSTENLQIIQSQPFPKREFGRQRGTAELVVPNIRPLGAQQELVDTVFEVAERVQRDGSILAAAPAERVGTAALESRLSLVVFRVDDYKPITLRDYQIEARSPVIGSWIVQGVMDGDVEHPLSEEALSKRTGFVRDGEEEKEKKEEEKVEEAKKTASAG